MGMTDPCVFFGVPPSRLFDPDLFERGVKVIDMDKLSRLVHPMDAESIADAVRRKFGVEGVDLVTANLLTANTKGEAPL